MTLTEHLDAMDQFISEQIAWMRDVQGMKDAGALNAYEQGLKQGWNQCRSQLARQLKDWEH